MAEAKNKPMQLDELAQQGWTEQEVEELGSIMAQRRDIKGREDVIKATKDELNSRASSIMLTHGLTCVASPIGTLTFKVTERKTLDSEKLKLELATRGIPIDTITQAFEAAMKSSTSTSVEFRASKEM